MRKAVVFGAATAALITMAGCASDYDYPYGYGVAVAYGALAYYDDYYGPYWNGYWGPQGAFWFSEAPGLPFHPDLDGHFRSFAAAGFQLVGGGRFHFASGDTVKTHS